MSFVPCGTCAKRRTNFVFRFVCSCSRFSAKKRRLQSLNSCEVSPRWFFVRGESKSFFGLSIVCSVATRASVCLLSGSRRVRSPEVFSLQAGPNTLQLNFCFEWQATLFKARAAAPSLAPKGESLKEDAPFHGQKEDDSFPTLDAFLAKEVKLQVGRLKNSSALLP